MLGQDRLFQNSLLIDSSISPLPPFRYKGEINKHEQHKMNSLEDGEFIKIRCLSPFVEGWKSKKQETKLEGKKNILMTLYS